MNNQPILFYSSRCSHSKQILDTLKALNKEGLCRMVLIDGKSREELPKFLKSVPTLYVPESQDMYIGKDIYSYIARPVQARREIPTTAAGQQSGAKPPAAGAAPGDYQAWSFEGGGLTDSYSSWEAPTKFTADDQLRYTFLDGSAVAPTPTAPATKQSYDGAKQGRNDDISTRMEQMKKAREAEFKGIARQ